MAVIKEFRFMSKIEIEAIAYKILQQMAKTPKYMPQWPLDASRVAEFLGLDVVWDKIPRDEEGEIAARILPLERLIEINEDIPQLRAGFGESTIAHEVGHWVLHINVEAVKSYLKLSKQGIYMKVEPLLCRNQDNLKGIEWQAQYFASCLLMPRYKLELAIQGRNLQKWSDLYEIAAELGVTISNLLHRLKDLGLINVRQNSRIISLN